MGMAEGLPMSAVAAFLTPEKDVQQGEFETPPHPAGRQPVKHDFKFTFNILENQLNQLQLENQDTQCEFVNVKLDFLHVLLNSYSLSHVIGYYT